MTKLKKKKNHSQLPLALVRLIQSEAPQVDVSLCFQSLLEDEDVIQTIHAGRLRLSRVLQLAFQQQPDWISAFKLD